MELLIKFSSALVLLITLAKCPPSFAQNTPKDYLDAHNEAREHVDVPPMHWDEEVADYAIDYAAKIKMANTCHKLVHSGGHYGENLAAGTGAFTGRRAVNLWVGEKPKYNYRTNSCVGGECRHYTQVVWDTSVKLGCARVLCKSGWWFVICSYAPRGNIAGKRPY